MDKKTLFKKGTEVFGSFYKFTSWLEIDNQYLGCKPIELYKDEKYQEIYDEILRIEHGNLA